MAISKDPKRISALYEVKKEDFDAIYPSTSSTAEKWWLAMDYHDFGNENSLTDKGTVRFPIKKLALLDDDGTIPTSMLPSYVAKVVPGNMVVNDTKYKFTALDGVVYVNGEPGEGETKALVNMVYLDMITSDTENENPYGVSYRYMAESDTFAVIPSHYIIESGEGTLCSTPSGKSGLYKKIDINIGDAVDRESGSVAPLAIATDSVDNERKLVHTKSGVVVDEATHKKSYGTTDNTPTTFTFGHNFTSHNVTVDETGHVTSATDYTIKIPDTAASSAVLGLAKTGESATHLSASSSAGTKTSNVYSAADHTHGCSSLTLGPTNSTITYTPSAEADKTYTAKELLEGVYSYSTTAVPAINVMVTSPMENANPVSTIIKNGTGASETWEMGDSLVGAKDCGSARSVITFGNKSDRDVNVNIASGSGNGELIYFHVPESNTPGVTSSVLFATNVNDSSKYTVKPITADIYDTSNDIVKVIKQIGGSDNGTATCSHNGAGNYATIDFLTKGIGSTNFPTHISFTAAPYTGYHQHYTLPLGMPTDGYLMVANTTDDKYTKAEGGNLDKDSAHVQLEWKSISDVLSPGTKYIFGNNLDYEHTYADNTTKSNVYNVIPVKDDTKKSSGWNGTTTLSDGKISSITIADADIGTYMITAEVFVQPAENKLSDMYYSMTTGLYKTTSKVMSCSAHGVIDWSLSEKQYITINAMATFDKQTGPLSFAWKIDGDIDLTGVKVGVTGFSMHRVSN